MLFPINNFSPNDLDYLCDDNIFYDLKYKREYLSDISHYSSIPLQSGPLLPDPPWLSPCLQVLPGQPTSLPWQSDPDLCQGEACHQEAPARTDSDPPTTASHLILVCIRPFHFCHCQVLGALRSELARSLCYDLAEDDCASSRVCCSKTHRHVSPRQQSEQLVAKGW